MPSDAISTRYRLLLHAVNPTGSFNSLDDWLPWLETLSPREIVLGLERVEEVLRRLDLPRPSLVISVAGTNGKGSSVAMLEALLLCSGARTGCYTSPHIIRYNERIRILGEPASDELIVSALTKVEAARGDVPLTFFEFGTLAALAAFDMAGADNWVLEVGLGGRLDAVNAIEPDASLITNVALDHCAWLGNDTESIAREKAGIMRRSKPVIFGSRQVPDAIFQAAESTGALLRVAGRDFDYGVAAEPGAGWSWTGAAEKLSALPMPNLHGSIQLQNASAVLAVLESLGMDRLLTGSHVSQALSNIRLQGRFQVIEKSCRWILDVAHNPAAAAILASQLDECDIDGEITAVIGMMADKDIDGFLRPLTRLVDRWIAVRASGTRAESATRLAARVANESGKPCEVAIDIADAMGRAGESARSADVVLVTGSFYLVGPALEWLHGN